ncbi:uracil/xanthine transporter [Metabacillus herbersteinensis]|uniref:Uracil/xanthine transporter n=1 Tax=Metabacillus herbersteinensis TaxID=283816 RepID=A0ABV6GGH6_9BACI
MNKLSSMTTAFASLQWLFFIFANIVVVPISVGMAFELSSFEVASILRSSLIVTGIACVLQGLIGHRYPILEGPSGVIWGLILNLSLSASTLGMSFTEIGGGIATGMLLAGGVTLILAACNLTFLLKKIFTPMVMSVYLFLLTFQLMIIFFEGMLKIDSDGRINLPISLFSVGLVVLVSFLKIKGNRLIRNFSILIGMVLGWILYTLLFSTEQSMSGEAAPAFTIFPFGMPNLEIGIIAITFLGCLLNLSNTIASVQAASILYKETPTKSQFKNSYLLTGCYSIVASLFGLVTYAPFASSIGFLESTQIFDRKPFIIGGALISVLGIIPSFGLLLSTLPITVGNAVLFVAYMQLFGVSLKSLNGYKFNSITIYRLAAPVLIGISIMTIEPSLFNNLPIYILPIVSNGFIVGVLLSIVLEKLVKWDDYSLEAQRQGA